MRGPVRLLCVLPWHLPIERQKRDYEQHKVRTLLKFLKAAEYCDKFCNLGAHQLQSCAQNEKLRSD